MEKKGEILNQLAIISDLIENINISNVNCKLTFELNNDDFFYIYKLIHEKIKMKMENLTDSFSLTIGTVDITFNRSNA